MDKNKKLQIAVAVGATGAIGYLYWRHKKTQQPKPLMVMQLATPKPVSLAHQIVEGFRDLLPDWMDGRRTEAQKLAGKVNSECMVRYAHFPEPTRRLYCEKKAREAVKAAGLEL